jgi:hypothetical protein
MAQAAKKSQVFVDGVYFIRFVEIFSTLETQNEIVQTEKIYAIGVRGEIDDRK